MPLCVNAISRATETDSWTFERSTLRPGMEIKGKGVSAQGPVGEAMDEVNIKDSIWSFQFCVIALQVKSRCDQRDFYIWRGTGTMMGS
jgi:hypothetical protein